jgi:hypothetical protein
MSGYRKRPDRIDVPGPLLGRLRGLRDDLIKTTMALEPFGIVHHALSMVVVAIDGVATVLTGRQYYFSNVGSGDRGTARGGGRETIAGERRDLPRVEQQAGLEFRRPNGAIMSDIELVDVVCMRGGEVIATYEFWLPVSLDVRSMLEPDREALILEAKTNLSDEGLAGPPFEGIVFEIKKR